MYLSPWRTSLSRALKFADRLFCYPEQAALDLSAGSEMFPHPARLRDVKPPRSIEFEVLCDFDPRGAVGGSHEPIFVSKEEKTNIRALLWLFKILKCHDPANRHRLNIVLIVLKWKDIRYTRPNALVLECHGGTENHYAYKEDPEHPTKVAIPNGLGIKERYMQVIEVGLDLWRGYLIESDMRDSLSDAQKAGVPKSKYWAHMPNDATKTFKIGMLSARNEVFETNLVNYLAVTICHNLRNNVFHYNDNAQLAYLEFWQRVSFDISPPAEGEMYHNGLTQEFLQYLNAQVSYTGEAIWEFINSPTAFVAKHKVKSQGGHFSKNPLDCDWSLANYIGLGTQPLRPWNDDSDSDG